jgi:RNA polymerase primary sigma factor
MFASLTNSDRSKPSLEADLALLLGHARGEDFPKRLFWELLSYDRVNDPLPLSVLPGDFRGDVAGACILARAGTLYVCYLHLVISDLSSGVERPILERLAGQWPAALVLFSNFGETEWDFCWHVAGRPRETQRLMVDADEQAVRKLARLLAGLAAVGSATGQTLPELELAKEFDRVFAKSPMQKRERIYEDQTDLIFRAIGKWQLLTAEEEKELSRRWRLFRDQQAREKLVCANFRLVFWVAQRYRDRGLDIEDLIQEGCRGLLTAADRFDPDRGFRFGTYATYWVRQSIQRAVLTKSFLVYVPAHLFEKERRLKKAERENNSPAGVAEALGLTREHLKRLFQARIAMRTRQGKRSGVVVLNRLQLVSPYRSLEEEAQREETCHIIENGLRVLHPRQEKVLRLRYGINPDHTQLTLEEIGQQMDITRERVRQIEEKALERIGHSSSRFGKNWCFPAT